MGEDSINSAKRMFLTYLHSKSKNTLVPRSPTNLRNLKELEKKYGLNASERTEVVIGFENMLDSIFSSHVVVEPLVQALISSITLITIIF
jgi:hypothetical protein